MDIDELPTRPAQPDFTGWPVPVGEVTARHGLTYVRSPDPHGYSVDDFRKIPDGRAELWSGVVVLRPDPTPQHQQIMSFLLEELAGRCPRGFRPAGGGREVRVGPATIFRPDLTVASRQRNDRRVLVVDAIPGRDGWERRYELDTKRSGYGRAGIFSCWFVDPENSSVVAYEVAYRKRDRFDYRTICARGEENRWGLWSGRAARL